VGRPSKGTRERFTTRVPTNLAKMILDEAERRGMTVNDWLLWAARTTIDTSRLQPSRGGERRSA
jgi:predicted HicB family RNase H-like nuclease